MSTIGGRIKYYRLLKGLKQKDIYEKIGINKATYIRFESKDNINHDIGVCKRICEAIGVKPELVYDDYMTFIDADYGTSIKSFRKKYKLTHEKFGELIGMNPKISARWEKGKCAPSRESYKKLMELFMKCG